MRVKKCICGGKAYMGYQPAECSERRGLPGVVVCCTKCNEHVGFWSENHWLEDMIDIAREKWREHVKCTKIYMRNCEREEKLKKKLM